jgi:hypothetical protein
MRERRLRAVQQAFLRSVLAGQEDAPEELGRLLRTPPAGSIHARWHVYARGFLARLVEAIENDYPALSKVLGEGPLRSLTARYVSRFPPRSHDLGRFGDRLAALLEADALTGDLPFLPDLARLEWAVAEAFVAPDVPELRWADLALLGPEAASEAPLALRPGAALVSSTWPIFEIWSCRDQPTEAIDVPLSRAARTVLVSRRGVEIVCRPAAGMEVSLFRATESGGRLADAVAEDGERADELVRAFRALVEDGVFARPCNGSPAAGSASTCGPRGG